MGNAPSRISLPPSHKDSHWSLAEKRYIIDYRWTTFVAMALAKPYETAKKCPDATSLRRVRPGLGKSDTPLRSETLGRDEAWLDFTTPSNSPY